MRPNESASVVSHGRLALLIPGLDGTGRLFYRQLPGLSSRYRVIPWEFRKRSRFDFEDLVEELGEGTAGEPPGSILVVGESFGGPVAMHYALAFPERVHTLVLINTFAFYRRRVRIGAACRLVPLLRVPGVDAIKDFVADSLLALEGIPAEDRCRYHEVVRVIDEAGYRQRLELVRGVNLAQRLHELQAPTLLFASGRDRLVPSVKEARFMASRIPHARVYEFPRAGHALLLTPGFDLSTYV